MPLTNHVAIFGGSFDPPHIGHETAVIWLMSALNATVVEIVPTFEHCFGKQLTDFEHRLEMCRIAFDKYDSIFARYGKEEQGVFVNDIERKLPKPNITYNLVKAIQSEVYYEDHEFAVAVGSDLVPELHTWEKWNEVSKMAKIVALGRSGFESTRTPFKIYQYPIELSAVSSSEIRDNIKRGESITGLVPHNVERYIYENKLYI
jgi:nicotinate-nucleotide adenylyltransferase